jgi:threonine/homoserine/homoserine lactone efflux protein
MGSQFSDDLKYSGRNVVQISRPSDPTRRIYLIDRTNLALFLSAALILAITPGPGMLYVLGRTLHEGRREGVLSALGTLVGGSFHVVAAAFGLSAILATSAIAFAIVRYAGAAYLVYLGIAMLRSRRMEIEVADEAGTSNDHFLQGITTEVLNPKTALFFLSFIPQFVTPSRGHLITQFLVLGAISVALNTVADLIVVVLAGAVAHKLKDNPTFTRRQRTVSGVGMIGLGAYVAVSK